MAAEVLVTKLLSPKETAVREWLPIANAEVVRMAIAMP
jgi:hypothetical protein